jgi:hypothetical protein
MQISCRKCAACIQLIDKTAVSNPFAMFSTHALREGRGYARTNVTTFTRFSQNWSMWSQLALYGSTTQPSRFMWFFLTIFFLLSVHSSLKKKRRKRCILILFHVGIWEHIILWLITASFYG